LGSQDHSNQILKYYCSKCDTLLKETNIDIDIFNSKEECPHCSSSVSETLRKGRKKEHKSDNINSHLDLLPKIQTAYEEFSSRLTFDIER
jgi:DNA-directed RNA polymerase subunit RPC12/RpoP